MMGNLAKELGRFIRNYWLVYVLMLVFSIIACYHFLTHSLDYNNDIHFHLARLLSTANALKDGQLLPQLDPLAAGGFGFAYNEFYGPLPTYFITFFYVILRNWALSVSIFVLLTTFLNAVISFHFVEFLLKNKVNKSYIRVSGLLTAFLLTFGPELTTNIYAFYGYGPHFGTVFVLLTFLGLTLIFRENRGTLAVILFGVGAAGLPLTHTILTLITVPFAFFYLFILFVAKRKQISLVRVLKRLVLGAFLSLALSAYFLLPMVSNLKSGIFNASDSAFSTAYSWDNPQNFVVAGDSLSVLTNGRGLSLALIIILVFLILASSLLLWKKLTSEVIFFTLSSIITIVVMNRSFIWRLSPSLFYKLQYPERFSVLVGIFFPIAVGLLFALLMAFINIKTLLYGFSILICAFATTNFFQKRPDLLNYAQLYQGTKPVEISDIYAVNFSPSIAVGEYLPKKTANLTDLSFDDYINHYHTTKEVYFFSQSVLQALTLRGNEPKSLTANTNITVDSKKGSHLNLTVKSNSNSPQVELPFIYYPGYVAEIKVRGEKQKIEGKVSPNGLVAIHLPNKFSGEIKVHFGMTKATLIGLSITLIGWVSIFFAVLKSYLKFKKNNFEVEK